MRDETGRRVPPRTAAELMGRDVVTIGPDASVRELARLLRAHRISGVPVVDAEGQAVGSVSVTDLLWLGDRLVPPLVPRGGKWTWEGVEGQTVRDIMTAEVFGLAPDADIDDVLEFFSGSGLRRAFIMEGKRVVGVVSITDLLELVDPGEPEHRDG